MTTTHHFEKDMPLERLLNFLCRYAWFKKTALFLGRFICALAWGLPMLLMAALIIYGGYRLFLTLLALENAVIATHF